MYSNVYMMTILRELLEIGLKDKETKPTIEYDNKYNQSFKKAMHDGRRDSQRTY